jgi:biopolymer transport protein ExbB
MNLGNLPVEATLATLLIMSVLTWVIGISKYLHQRRLARDGQAFLADFWACKDLTSAAQIAAHSPSDFALLARAGFDAHAEHQQDLGSLRFYGEVHEVIERPLRQTLSAVLRQHEKGQAVLASIGSTAPFVGLFGTVWGIMEALKVIGLTGQATIDIVAGPIGDALIATAVGILTAIPAVLLYNYFVRQLRVRNTELEGFAEDLLKVVGQHAAKTASATKD